LQDQIADAITSFSGRLMFVYVHIVWFGAWILLNTGRFGVKTFDPFPYGLLTMVVSLEAIFLSTFVLISQNRLSEEAENRADLRLQIGLLTEHEVSYSTSRTHRIGIINRLNFPTYARVQIPEFNSAKDPTKSAT